MVWHQKVLEASSQFEGTAQGMRRIAGISETTCKASLVKLSGRLREVGHHRVEGLHDGQAPVVLDFQAVDRVGPGSQGCV